MQTVQIGMHAQVQCIDKIALTLGQFSLPGFSLRGQAWQFIRQHFFSCDLS